MVNALNQKVIKQDWAGFGETYAKFAARDVRFGSTDFQKLGDKTAKTMASIDALGKYVSHTKLKGDRCGDRIAREVSVFFSEDGQFYIIYWLFKANEQWALTNLNMKGDGSTTKFTAQLSEVLKVSCS